MRIVLLHLLLCLALLPSGPLCAQGAKRLPVPEDAPLGFIPKTLRPFVEKDGVVDVFLAFFPNSWYS